MTRAFAYLYSYRSLIIGATMLKFDYLSTFSKLIIWVLPILYYKLIIILLLKVYAVFALSAIFILLFSNDKNIGSESYDSPMCLRIGNYICVNSINKTVSFAYLILTVRDEGLTPILNGMSIKGALILLRMVIVSRLNRLRSIALFLYYEMDSDTYTFTMKYIQLFFIGNTFKCNIYKDPSKL
jgi:hypothetical protein